MTAIAMPAHDREIFGPATFLERVFPITSDMPHDVSQKIIETRVRFAEALDVERMNPFEMMDFIFSLENPKRFNHIYPD